MDDESIEQQIVKMEKRLAPLRIEHEQLSRESQSKQAQIVRLEALHAEEASLKRDIARLKGEKPDDDDYSDES